jgi:hypothetical protein
MSEPSEIELRQQLQSIGIHIQQEQDAVLSKARCMKIGVATGGGWAIYASPAGVPGFLGGFLSGFITGTAVCAALSLAEREALRKLAMEQ